MKKEKIFALSILGLIMISLLVGVVSAQTTADKVGTFFQSLINGIQKAGEPIFKALLGNMEVGGDLFSKILLFLLVTFIIVAVLGSVGFFASKTWLTWLIAIVISIFGIRFIPIGLIETITIPSSALALIIGMGLPFLIFFLIIQRIENGFIRRAGWVVFAVLIAFLWVYNWNNTNLDKFRWIYIIAIVACIIAFWFDGTLQKLMGKAKAKRVIEGYRSREINRIKAKIADLETAFANARTDGERKQIKGQIDELMANL